MPLSQNETSSSDEGGHGKGEGEGGGSQEQSTGRWTKVEHEAFLSGLKEFGKEWKKVARRVGTRTVVQTRTHAQKYFQKLAKQDSPGGINMGDIVSQSTSSKLFTKEQYASPSSPMSDHRFTSPQQYAERESENVSIATETNALHFMARNASFRHSNLNAALASTPPPDDSYDPYMSSVDDSSLNASDSIDRKRLKLIIPEKATSTNTSALNKHNNDKWPQPSPAACGHRKKEEVDAATLLVNFEDSNIKHGGAKVLSNFTRSSLSKISQPMSSRNHLQIINPEKLSSFSRAQMTMQLSQPTTPFDVQVQDILPKEGPQLPQATPDSTGSNPTHLRQMPLTPIMKEQVNHDDPSVTLLHHAVIELDYSLVANLISSSSSGRHQHQYHDAITGPSKPYGFTILHSLAWLSSHLGIDEDARGSSLLLILGILNHMQWDVNIRESKGGNTALHFASYNGDLKGESSHVAEEVVKWLIERGADRDATNCQNHTPLHLAMSCGTRGGRVANKLLDMGCNVSARDSITGLSCIGAACANLSPFPSDQLASNSDSRKCIEDEEHSKESVSIDELQKTISNFFEHAPRARTLVVSGDDVLERRVSPIFIQCVPTIETQRASLEDLQLVHSNDYIASLVKELPTELVQKYRQGAGSALFAIDRVLMNRVRNGIVFVPIYLPDNINETISISNQPKTSPLNTPLITTFHALGHARCNRCALIDLGFENNQESNIHDNIIMRYPEPSRLFYYRPGQTSEINPTKSDLQYNIIRVENDREQFRQNINNKLLPTLRAFAPDLIIMKISSLHDDIPWVTKKIAVVADMCCQGRIVSIVETEAGSSEALQMAEFQNLSDHLKLLIDSCHSMINVSRSTKD